MKLTVDLVIWPFRNGYSKNLPTKSQTGEEKEKQTITKEEVNKKLTFYVDSIF